MDEYDALMNDLYGAKPASRLDEAISKFAECFSYAPMIDVETAGDPDELAEEILKAVQEKKPGRFAQ